MASDRVKRKVFRKEGHSVVEVIILPDLFGLRPSAYIHKVYTDSEYQGRGLASDLIQVAIAYAKAEGCYKAFLVCQEKVVPFYERLGFRKGQMEMSIRL